MWTDIVYVISNSTWLICGRTWTCAPRSFWRLSMELNWTETNESFKLYFDIFDRSSSVHVLCEWNWESFSDALRTQSNLQCYEYIIDHIIKFYYWVSFITIQRGLLPANGVAEEILRIADSLFKKLLKKQNSKWT